ncbi:uncharacterized protein DSM5745_06511 [Aspergillus mulundensis]|uniref:Peptidase S1 domain-containing protein n=1 Tax=Aspergillus mulundensis TaxID=1810919 RepID=A0A3D8RR38_9EURO|nr:hypothetical protein DSM5745_06511 [Aspergillus mulundensis]RDW76519.1 hypothetical protein DSM5745_06511 [Aspergillus mulundensis]
MRPIPILSSLFLSALANKRIIGGDEIDIKQAPYHVALFAYGDFAGSGTIINHNTIITAAHCISGPPPADITVRAGSSSYLSGGTLLNVTKITKHPSYNQPIVLENDIAIMTLAENLTFGDTIQPLGLPAYARGSPGFSNAGEQVFISGWGDTITSGTLQTQLRAVTVDILDQTECKARYEDYVIPVTDGMFCNGVPGGGRGPLSTSPLVPLTVIKGAGHEFIQLPAGENAITADFHSTRTKTESPAHITSGFYKIEAGAQRPAHYTYEETKYVLSGQIDVLDEATGITHHLVPGDFAFFYVGSKVKFSTKSQGLAFYAVTRPIRSPHVNLLGREESKSRL